MIMTLNIYHITHIDNLDSIIESGGLFAKRKSQLQQKKYKSIAYENLQDRRAQTPVPCAKGGTLHNYVPFYFAPRSPMLYTISKGNVQGYNEGQTPVIYLVVDAEKIEENNFSFAFTDGHPIMEYSDFFNDFSDLEKIDWDLMEDKYWSDTKDDPDRKRRRQAEFLVYDWCPWKFVEEIGVIDHSMKLKVTQILKNLDDPPPVRIWPNWYY
jgi:ssDNA thymidine ADP-ribosyltransferase, DarT